MGAAEVAGVPFKRGDLIGKYQVQGVLGQGGFGVVYLVYSPDLVKAYALKTLRDERFGDPEVVERFLREAKIWVGLEPHPFLVHAHFVFENAGRIFIALEHIPPNDEGLNSLDGYLEQNPPDLLQSLRWSIQFCFGMEYAYSKGVRCHRDIKPANIMIGQDGAVKISDFGLAGILNPSRKDVAAAVDTLTMTGENPWQTVKGAVGTILYMPPEQFLDAGLCDERSDIYSFGIVLYQMAAGGQPPFFPTLQSDIPKEEAKQNWVHEVFRLHAESSPPALDSPLFSIIRKCLEKDPANRYQNFETLREDLAIQLQELTGEVISLPETDELQAYEWSNRGASLVMLRMPEEALSYFDKAIELVPQDPGFRYNKAGCLRDLKRYQEAIEAYKACLRLDPSRLDGWHLVGICHVELGELETALKCLDTGLQVQGHGEGIDRDVRVAEIWRGRGFVLFELNRFQESYKSYSEALKLRHPEHWETFYNRGNCLLQLNRYQEAIFDYWQAIELEPNASATWFNKASTESRLHQWAQAVYSYRRFLTLATSEDEPRIKIARQAVEKIARASFNA